MIAKPRVDENSDIADAALAGLMEIPTRLEFANRIAACTYVLPPSADTTLESDYTRISSPSFPTNPIMAHPLIYS
jgi:hypothetical protein